MWNEIKNWIELNIEERQLGGQKVSLPTGGATHRHMHTHTHTHTQALDARYAKRQILTHRSDGPPGKKSCTRGGGGRAIINAKADRHAACRNSERTLLVLAKVTGRKGRGSRKASLLDQARQNVQKRVHNMSKKTTPQNCKTPMHGHLCWCWSLQLGDIDCGNGNSRLDGWLVWAMTSHFSAMGPVGSNPLFRWASDIQNSHSLMSHRTYFPKMFFSGSPGQKYGLKHWLLQCWSRDRETNHSVVKILRGNNFTVKLLPLNLDLSTRDYPPPRR